MMGLIGCLETSATCYSSKLRNVPEDRRTHSSAAAWSYA